MMDPDLAEYQVPEFTSPQSARLAVYLRGHSFVLNYTLIFAGDFS